MATLDDVFSALTLCAVLGCGLMAGVFFAFSAFIMKALTRLPPRDGIAAMQSMNVAVLNPWFLRAFFGTAAVCVLVLLSFLWRWHEPGAVYLVVGSLLVTIVCNVPRNEVLAAVAPADPDSASLWAGYVVGWTTWNHVRTAAAASFGVALG